jgi:hypothetical protein
MTTITIAEVNQPKTNAAGQTSKSGTVITTDGMTYRAWLDKLPLFQSLIGQTVEVNVEQKDYGTYISIAPRTGGAPLAPPRPAQPYTPPRPASPQTAPGLQSDRRLVELEKFFEMYVTGSVGRHLGSGKAASEHDVIATEAVRIFEQIVAPAFLRLSNLLSAPKVPPMPKLVTGTDNKWTSPPKDEPGDPGPVELQ